jgi:hypothetical protein
MRNAGQYAASASLLHGLRGTQKGSSAADQVIDEQYMTVEYIAPYLARCG